MTDEPLGLDLNQLLKKGEDEHLEFKVDVPGPASAAQSIASLANSGGGQLVVGVDERSGIVGLNDPFGTERILNEAAALVSADVEVEKQRSGPDGAPILIAQVKAAADGPVAAPDGTLMRRGPDGRMLPLTAAELARLAAADPNAQRHMTELLASMNEKLVALQRTVDKEHSPRSRLVDWVGSGFVGAVIGIILTLVISA